MPQQSSLISALQRLNNAMSHLETSVDTILEREQNLKDSEAEVQRMGADRTRLAEALDAAEERSQQLENVNGEVSRRLVNAMESIRNVIDGQSITQE